MNLVENYFVLSVLLNFKHFLFIKKRFKIIFQSANVYKNIDYLLQNTYKEFDIGEVENIYLKKPVDDFDFLNVVEIVNLLDEHFEEFF